MAEYFVLSGDDHSPYKAPKRIECTKRHKCQQTAAKYFVGIDGGIWKHLPAYLYLTKVCFVRDRAPQAGFKFNWKRFWRLPYGCTWRLQLYYTECRTSKPIISTKQRTHLP